MAGTRKLGLEDTCALPKHPRQFHCPWALRAPFRQLQEWHSPIPNCHFLDNLLAPCFFICSEGLITDCHGLVLFLISNLLWC
jgi:hypothetical protein